MISNDKTKITYYFFGTFIPRLISFTFLPILSFFLSKNELGEYDLFLSSLSLLIPIITLQIEEAYYRWHFENPQNLIKTVIYFSFFSHLLFLVIAITMFYYKILHLNIIFLFALFSSSFPLLFQFIARSLNKMAVYTMSAFANSFGILIVTFLLFFFKNITLNSIAVAYIISNLVTFVILIYKLQLYKIIFIGSFDYNLIKKLLKFSIPLIPNTISWWMVNLANRYIITINLGVSYNASYAVAARIPSLLILLNSIFLLFIQDIVFKTATKLKNKSEFNTIFRNYFQMQLTIAIVIVSFSKLMVNLLFSNIYSSAYKLVPLIVIGIILTNLCAFFAVFFLAEKKTPIILISTILGAILNLFFTQYTIATIGLYAPALGTAIGFLLICGIRIHYLKKYQKINLHPKPFIGLVCLFVVFSLSLFADNIFVEILFMIVSFLLFYFINKNLLQQFAKQLLNVRFK